MRITTCAYHTFFAQRKCAKKCSGGDPSGASPPKAHPLYGQSGGLRPPYWMYPPESRAKVDMCALPTWDKYKSRFGVTPKAGLRAS